jgi:hypothetical protein
MSAMLASHSSTNPAAVGARKACARYSDAIQMMASGASTDWRAAKRASCKLQGRAFVRRVCGECVAARTDC